VQRLLIGKKIPEKSFPKPGERIVKEKTALIVAGYYTRSLTRKGKKSLEKALLGKKKTEERDVRVDIYMRKRRKDLNKFFVVTGKVNQEIAEQLKGAPGNKKTREIGN